MVSAFLREGEAYSVSLERDISMPHLPSSKAIYPYNHPRQFLLDLLVEKMVGLQLQRALEEVDYSYPESVESRLYSTKMA